MNTEPVRNPDELPTAQRLAQHPLWTLRPRLCVRWRGKPYTIATARNGYPILVSETTGAEVRLRPDTQAGPGVYYDHGALHPQPRMLLFPDLADDATAGIVRGMLQTWAAKVGGLVEIHAGTNQAVVVVSFEEAGAPWATRIRRLGATVGDAAGQCLLACWARDESQCP